MQTIKTHAIVDHKFGIFVRSIAPSKPNLALGQANPTRSNPNHPKRPQTQPQTQPKPTYPNDGAGPPPLFPQIMVNNSEGVVKPVRKIEKLMKQ